VAGRTVCWYPQDGLGSVRQLVVGDSVMNSYAYTAWGVPLNWHKKVSNRYTYTGREHNPETSLYHYRFREYCAVLGVFTATEPLYSMSMHYYIYAVANPTRHKDPLGWQAMPGDIAPTLWEKAQYPGDREAQERAAAARFNLAVFRNRLGNVDLGKEEVPAPDRSRTSRLELIKRKATELLQLVKKCQISDCEALARLAEFVAKFHTRAGVFGTDDEASFVNDLARVLAGRHGRFAAVDRRYYVAGFYDSCFKNRYRGQIRSVILRVPCLLDGIGNVLRGR